MRPVVGVFGFLDGWVVTSSVVEGVDCLELVGEGAFGDQGDGVVCSVGITEPGTMESCAGVVVGVEVGVFAGVFSRGLLLGRRWLWGAIIAGSPFLGF